MTEQSIHEHLAELQVKLSVPKNNWNDFGNYYSRSAEDILEALKPLLEERGLTITTPCYIQETQFGVYQRCVATLSDGKDSIEVEGAAKEHPEKKKQDNSQLSGGAMSYAKKYALGNLFAIDDTKDADQLKPEEHKNPASQIKQEQQLDNLPEPLFKELCFLGKTVGLNKEEAKTVWDNLKGVGITRGRWDNDSKTWSGTKMTRKQAPLVIRAFADQAGYKDDAKQALVLQILGDEPENYSDDIF